MSFPLEYFVYTKKRMIFQIIKRRPRMFGIYLKNNRYLSNLQNGRVF